MAQPQGPRRKSPGRIVGAVEGHRVVIIRDGKFVGPLKSGSRPADEMALSPRPPRKKS
jgi:hypothetical protein